MQSTQADALNAKSGVAIGAEWQHALKKRPKGSDLIGACVPDTHLRLAGDTHAALIAKWAVNAAQPGVAAKVRITPGMWSSRPPPLEALSLSTNISRLSCVITDGVSHHRHAQSCSKPEQSMCASEHAAQVSDERR